MLHGLEGSERSHYIAGMLAECVRRGWAATVLVARTCDGRMPRGRVLYHSGATGDLDAVARRLAEREPGRTLFAVGYSMGANILGKWLGEAGATAPVAAAALVCTPFVLRQAGPALDRTAGGLYSRRFLATLIPKALRKAREFPDLLDADRIRSIRTILEYDHEVTARLHGFRDAWDYYDRSSSAQFLPDVRVPTLLLSAADDPLVPRESFPFRAARGSRWLEPRLHRRGGHIGFVGGPWPWRADYWAEREVAGWLAPLDALRGGCAR